MRERNRRRVALLWADDDSFVPLSARYLSATNVFSGALDSLGDITIGAVGAGRLQGETVIRSVDLGDERLD